VVATSIGVWVTNVSFLVRSESFYPLTSNSLIVQVNSVPLQLRPGTGILACLPRNAETSKLGTTSTFVTDIVLLLIMLVGLLRLRVQGAGALSLGQLLWKQGIIWFLIATAAGALPTIFLFHDLNDAWRIMFQFPWMISISVAATRMYRSLTDFVSGVPDTYPSTQSSTQGGSGPTSRFLQNPGVQPFQRLEVIVHSTRVWDSMVQMSDHGSYPSTDGPVTYKPNDLTSD